MIEEEGVKIASPTEAIWENVRKEAELLIKDSERNLVIQEAMLKLAEEKLADENAL